MGDDDDVFSQLPLDVLFLILVKLPTYSLVQLRRVSKSFNALVLHPHFLKLGLTADRRLHVIHYESTDDRKAYFSFHADKTFSPCHVLESPFNIDRRDLYIVGSDRGVVCLFDSKGGTVMLWNPFIGKLKIIPSFPQELMNCPMRVADGFGFGFDHVKFDFKIVVILRSCDDEMTHKALIYSVKSGSWGSSELAVPCFVSLYDAYGYGSVLVNGAAHWLACKQPSIEGQQPDCIVGFDVVEDAFKSMEAPQNMKHGCKVMKLCCWIDEKTVGLLVSYDSYMGPWDLWVMSEYGNAESWTRKRTIGVGLWFVNGGDLLAEIYFLGNSDDKVVLFDFDEEQVKDIQGCEYWCRFTYAYASNYIPSLALEIITRVRVRVRVRLVYVSATNLIKLL